MYPGSSQEATIDAVKKVANSIIKDNMGVKPGESILILTDTVRKDLGAPIYQAALESGNDAVYIEMKPRDMNGDEPPDMVADAMCEAQVIVAVTKTSISHTKARFMAVDNGARIATMPYGARSTEFVTQIFTTGGMTADYKKMDGNIRMLADRLRGTREAHVTTEKGTDVRVEYRGRQFFTDTGIAHEPGQFTNLPAGELYVAPVNANGIIVVDLTIGRLGRLVSPLELHVKDGVVTSITGEQAKDVEKILSPFGPEAMNLGEFAIGMNPKAKICGLLLEDEKVADTVHFALGNNAGFGGHVCVGVHMDAVIDRPTIHVDGEKLDVRKYI
jgi:aminopeptidase